VVPAPKDPGQEKVDDIRKNGGAVKVQKAPEHVEGITPLPAADQEGHKAAPQNKKTKKVK
jgi:hypothetical protein